MMRLHKIKAISLVAMILLCTAAVGAATLKVTVTAVAGRSVFVDAGRTSGVAPGLRVRFFPAGAGQSDGVIADVSASSARVELLQGNMPPAGTAGEIDVPDPVQEKSSVPLPATLPTTVPAHPPWERQVGDRTPDMPLLAPAFARPPSERQQTFHGRAYTDFNLNLDRGDVRDHYYLSSRTGLAFTLTNPLGQGGELRFDGEVDVRDSDASNNDYASEDNAVIRRLSYAIGTERYSPFRLEMGRFTSYYLPEIGTVDGLEGAVRFQNGLSLGAGLGGYPRPFVRRDTGQDIGFHLFANYSPDNPNALYGTVGYQKTWRDGEPDRDLLIANASIRPTKSIWLFGSAAADIYSAGNPLKSAGPELTRALFQARFSDVDTRGASILYSRYRWADIRGVDFPTVSDALVSDGRVDRVEMSVWHDIVTDVRPTVRIYYFDSHRASGLGGELDLDWTKIGGGPVDLHNAIFVGDGEYSDDWGFRSQVSIRSGKWDLHLGYDFLRYSFPETQPDTGTFTRQTIRAGIGWQVGDWSYNVSIDRQFGDLDDAYLLSAYIEYRF